MIMEVARHWRNQESNYIGPGSRAFEVKVAYREEENVRDYTIRTRLHNKRVSFSVNGEGSAQGAGEMVFGLRSKGYKDEVILSLALEMLASHPELGEEFVDNVAEAMTEDLSVEEKEKRLFELVGGVL